MYEVAMARHLLITSPKARSSDCLKLTENAGCKEAEQWAKSKKLWRQVIFANIPLENSFALECHLHSNEDNGVVSRTIGNA